MEPIEVRLKSAVERGRAARSKYYEAIELPDEQSLDSPASDEQLRELEEQLGQPLPPSYRIFMLLYGEWAMVSGAVSLLSAGSLLAGTAAEEIKQWQKNALNEGDTIAANGFVVGVSDVTATTFLLDPDQVNVDGEWAFVRHHLDEEISYPSFLAWLEESVADFEALHEEETGDGPA